MLGSNSLDEIALWMGLIGLPFVVHGPPELVGRIRDLARVLHDAADAVGRRATIDR